MFTPYNEETDDLYFQTAIQMFFKPAMEISIFRRKNRYYVSAKTDYCPYFDFEFSAIFHDLYEASKFGKELLKEFTDKLVEY